MYKKKINLLKNEQWKVLVLESRQKYQLAKNNRKTILYQSVPLKKQKQNILFKNILYKNKSDESYKKKTFDCHLLLFMNNLRSTSKIIKYIDNTVFV